MNQQIEYNNDTKIADKKDIDVYLAEEYIKNLDKPIPTIWFSCAEYILPFYQTRETLADLDKYKTFINNCTHRFRSSRSYKNYKAYLMSLGLNRSQILGNIEDGMSNIEMHHNFLTIFDITILISQHILNTVGRCTTFDIVSLLIQEHRLNNIPIVMLDETSHQLYHDNPDFYIPISMTFGQWWNLLMKYRYGITLDIAYKVIKYIKNCQSNNELNDLSFYQLQNTVKSWGDYNDFNNDRVVGMLGTINYGGYIDDQNNTISNQYTTNQNGEQDKNRGILSEGELFGSEV